MHTNFIYILPVFLSLLTIFQLIVKKNGARQRKKDDVLLGVPPMGFQYCCQATSSSLSDAISRRQAPASLVAKLRLGNVLLLRPDSNPAKPGSAWPSFLIIVAPGQGVGDSLRRRRRAKAGALARGEAPPGLTPIPAKNQHAKHTLSPRNAAHLNTANAPHRRQSLSSLDSNECIRSFALTCQRP